MLREGAASLRQVIAGGLSSDFGTEAVFAGQVAGGTGTLQIPFLLDADNLTYELDGHVRKLGGTRRLNSVGVGSAIRGLYDYWTARSPVRQRRFLHAGTQVFMDNADGSFTAVFSGLSNDSVPNYVTFMDQCILLSDGDLPRYTDGATFGLLGGSPPAVSFGCVHKNRLFAAGDRTNPSALYFSDAEDAHNGLSANAILVDPDDGDSITAIASHKNELWVWKGPHKGSIHRIAGDSPTGSNPFNKLGFIHEGLGCAGPNLLFRLGDDLHFVWIDGSVHSLATTAAYSDFYRTSLSAPINEMLRDRVSSRFLKRGWAASLVGRGLAALSMPFDGSDQPNMVLAVDARFQPARWATWSDYGRNPSVLTQHYARAMAVVIDPKDSNRPKITIGGSDGFVRTTLDPNRAIDGSVAIPFKVRTPATNYGLPASMKNLHRAALGMEPSGMFNAELTWYRDEEPPDSTTVTMTSGTVLATTGADPVPPAFELDNPTYGRLGGQRFVDRMTTLEEGGEFRSIAYEVTQDGLSEDIALHGITVQITVGAESWE